MGWDFLMLGCFLIPRFKLLAQICFFYNFIKDWFKINLVHLSFVVGVTRIFSWPGSQPHRLRRARVGSCRVVRRIRVKNARGVEIKEPTRVPLPPTRIRTCGWSAKLHFKKQERVQTQTKLNTLSVNDTDTKVDDDHLSGIRGSC